MSHQNDIAIVGMAAHLPGADTLESYWANLRDGVESIRRLDETALLAAGETPDRLYHKDYVRAAAILDRFEWFDGDFFGFGPKESAILDPQHRQFLEVAWEALENAGHPPEKFPGAIGVYAGCGMGSYFYFNICSNPDLVEKTGMFLLRHTGNDKDFLATRVSHVFDLKGPSINLQTACSTSLVATHFACQALLNGECDMALAGGVTIELPHGRGYVFKEGEILSPDGHCHAFDHRAQGTVFGSGAGVVVLRRLEDAIADGDHIWAVIKGTAVNNDGAAKAGYLAPSVDGQARAIAEAHAVAGVSADTIGYVECHGTGTYLGDPIEVAALTAAFRETTAAKGFCGIGSVKTNIGHTDTAAGVAGLIKTSLALHHRQIPPSLGFEAPNPAIDFDGSPFRVNAALAPWQPLGGLRRAGVNSLGVGGTNAHAVLEEAPAVAASEPSDWPFQILTLSARSRSALDDASRRLAAHLRAHPEQPLADIAWTLKEGRRAFERRRILVAASHDEAAALLEAMEPRRVFTHAALSEDRGVVFMFPGGGVQYAGMARDLYETEPVFAEWMDRGLAILQPKLDYDMRALWLPTPEAQAGAVERLRQPSVQLPLIMIVEYALAQLWMSWGLKPAALVGHSMGENTAACLAGVMAFEDCIGLVHLRGQLFDTVPAGGMLSVPLAAGDLAVHLGEDLDIASVNAPELTVASGPQAALDALQARLAASSIDCQRIPIDIAAHSRMLEPILGRFGAYLRSIRLSPPKIPFVSNRSGHFVTDAEATDPEYWVGHLRGTVRFADCITTLAQEPGRIYLEMGPGKALSSLVQAHGAVPSNQVLSALRHPEENIPDDAYFLQLLGRLWAVGVTLDWEPIWGEARRRRVPLPTYAFQRAAYFIEPGAGRTPALPGRLVRTDDITGWGWRPVWRPRLADCEVDVDAGLDGAIRQTWLIFVDDAGVGARVVARLRGGGHRVIEVHPGDAFGRAGTDRFVLSPEHGRDGYDALLRDLVAAGTVPSRVAHFWLTTDRETFRPGSSFFHRNQERGFFSLLFLAQAISAENLPGLHVTVVTTGAAQVRREPLPYPEKATVLGPARVIPRELPGVTVATLDVVLPPQAPTGFLARRPSGDGVERLATQILEDLLAAPGHAVAALRGDRRFELGFQPMPLAAPAAPALRERGVCLITGGFGGIGLTIAETLVRQSRARLVLLSRRALPARDRWDGHLRGHGPFDAVSRAIRAVQRLESLGAEVVVATADVCNLEEMRAAVALATERFGAVHAVVHAAGVVDDGPLLGKTPAAVEDVFTPKIHGTLVLHDLFPDGSLDWLVLFSSTSTVTAPAGQVDYVAANEFLNAYARGRRGDRTRVLAIDWGIWNEVGMAAAALAERTGDRPEAPAEPAGVPLLDTASFDAAGHRIFRAHYATGSRWLVDEHRTRSGEALVPGTGYLEIAAEALAAHGEIQPFEVQDLFFLRPLQVPDGAGRDVMVRLARSDEGYSFEMRSDARVDGRPAMVLNARADLSLLPLAAPAPVDLAAVAARCPDRRTADRDATLVSPQEAHLRFGPRWRVLRSLAYGTGEGIADLALDPRFAADIAGGIRLHPALLDLATGWAMELIEGYRPDHLWVPVSYSSVRVHASLAMRIASWVRLRVPATAAGPTATFDVTLCDPEGRVLVEIEGFSIRRLEAGFGPATAPSAAEVEFLDGGGGARQPLSPAEERLAHNLSQGILPAEGGEAFVRALAAGEPQVVVSSLDLDTLVAQAAEGAVPEMGASGQSFQRPELDSAYVEPRNDIERMLVGFWEELLGVSNVGVEDSFFDLGGHSLIAVRLFVMIKKAYRVEFPISVLFEAPTIAKCAALIEARVGPSDPAAPDGDAAAGPRPQARRFTHLVPMHDGEGGRKTPFFLVAGMFGNVLNLRHLAHLLGADRPFYGLQARGLYGGEEPHRSFLEAAIDYIAEMREVQPRGPYLLGGFSGGGIIAYEIARQLEAAGEEVALVVMLDTPLPRRQELSSLDRAIMKWQDIRRGGPAYFYNWGRDRIAWEIGRLRNRLETPEAPPEHQFHNAAIEAAFRAALPGYDLKPWDGRLVLFRPAPAPKWQVSGGRTVDHLREYIIPDNGWTRWAANTEVHEVPGDHDSMVLEPNVRVLAGRMKACIEAAEANRDPRPRPDLGAALATAAE